MLSIPSSVVAASLPLQMLNRTDCNPWKSTPNPVILRARRPVTAHPMFWLAPASRPSPPVAFAASPAQRRPAVTASSGRVVFSPCAVARILDRTNHSQGCDGGAFLQRLSSPPNRKGATIIQLKTPNGGAGGRVGDSLPCPGLSSTSSAAC